MQLISQSHRSHFSDSVFLASSVTLAIFFGRLTDDLDHSAFLPSMPGDAFTSFSLLANVFLLLAVKCISDPTRSPCNLTIKNHFGVKCLSTVENIMHVGVFWSRDSKCVVHTSQSQHQVSRQTFSLSKTAPLIRMAFDLQSVFQLIAGQQCQMSGFLRPAAPRLDVIPDTNCAPLTPSGAFYLGDFNYAPCHYRTGAYSCIILVL